MLKLIKRSSKVSRILFALTITLAIACLSLIKIGKQPINISHLDKIEHAIAYFVLTITWLFAFIHHKNKILIIISCLFYGIIIEVLQATITTYRTGDYYDILANSTGILLAYLIFCFFNKKSESI
ncbi:VanZ family protein [Tenacibaculum holothuriorum]|uniref:VanZ family protein n=1 Tax=Tenacibaculum holothuriorum TaxID=1635173 RepID=UPI001E3DE01E|nr:VanZ family protein [Tenacibaculum holothuriorum]